MSILPAPEVAPRSPASSRSCLVARGGRAGGPMGRACSPSPLTEACAVQSAEVGLHVTEQMEEDPPRTPPSKTCRSRA